jgi:TonB family protein
MKLVKWLRQQGLRFVHGDTVPGVRSLSLSVFLHALTLSAVALFFVFQRSAPVIIFPEKRQLAKGTPGALYMPPRAQRAPLQIAQRHARRPLLKSKKTEMASAVEGPSGEVLRQQAKAETVAIIQNFKFRTTYGFSPFPRYELAFQIAGQIPTISAAQLPPRFEQYVVVEVTINSHGQVADARVISGDVDSKIQDTLLSAIREFKYRPATREGVPIPSQCDIVIHIPT